MPEIDLLIHHAAQVLTCAQPDGPKHGPAMREVGAIPDGAVAIADGRIIEVGPSATLCAAYSARQRVDASGRVVCPGFVDPHTHVAYAGDRIQEFEQRIAGQSYMEIMAAGGGIAATTRATRAADLTELVEQTRRRLEVMLSLGTTTAEVKTGYGLDVATELKLLETIADLAGRQPVELIPTFLGAHAVPPEYTGHTDDYVTLVVNAMLPAARAWYTASGMEARSVPFFIDVFCEQNAFSVEQSRRVLEAGRASGLRVKAHVDEFTELGGLALALELGATSVDHLDATGPAGIAQLAASTTVGVVIPAVNFNLGSHHFANARAMIDAGAALALTTDINPGSAPCPSLPLVMAIACRYQRLLPAEALTACTLNAAHAIGLGATHGSLEVGKQADVLILGVKDYRHLAYQFGSNLVQTVIKRGRLVHSAVA